MAAGRLSPSPRCSQCGAKANDDANYCMDCGAALELAGTLTPRLASPGLAPARIVESDGLDASDAAPAPMELVESRPESNALALLPHLAAMAWQRPAVRRAVTTGASAVALSFVWRVAGAALSSRRASGAMLGESDGLAPLVGDVLRGAKLSKRLGRRGRRGSVIEETLYIRRITRR
ncbi:MAG TPA: zinc ribbon domain-containing protein [Ktedonobacterales bacterium]